MGRQWTPFHPRSALTGCDSDRDVGLTDKPASQADDGRLSARSGTGRWSRKALPDGRPIRMGEPTGGRGIVSFSVRPERARQGAALNRGGTLSRRSQRGGSDGLEDASLSDDRPDGTDGTLRRTVGLSVKDDGRRKLS